MNHCENRRLFNQNKDIENLDICLGDLRGCLGWETGHLIMISYGKFPEVLR